jgi:hypothetical protein
MKGGGDGRLRRLTNFFIEALFYSERADEDSIDDPEECNEQIEVAKQNIMKSRERYGSAIPGLTEKGMKIYIDKITKHFNDLYSDDLTQYPRVEDDIVAKFVEESIVESSVAAGAGKSKKKKKATKKKAAKKKATKKKAAKKKAAKKKATKKKAAKKKATKKAKHKLSGNRKCSGLDEKECKSTSRCTWNKLDTQDFSLNTLEGKEKLSNLRENIVKTHTKGELIKLFGNDNPSLEDIHKQVLEEKEKGYKGICGEKMFIGPTLTKELEKRMKNISDKRGRVGEIKQGDFVEGETLMKLLQDRMNKDFKTGPTTKTKKSRQDHKVDRVDEVDVVDPYLFEAELNYKGNQEYDKYIKDMTNYDKKVSEIKDRNQRALRIGSISDMGPNSDVASDLVRQIEGEGKAKK